MKMNMLVSVIACAAVLSASAAVGASPASDVAVAFAEKQQLTEKLQPIFANPANKIRALCGFDSPRADLQALRIAGNSFAALSKDVAKRAHNNRFMKELAKAYYGRSQIYYGVMQSSRINQRELAGRLRGNDKRIESVMRAAHETSGALKATESIQRAARKNVDALLVSGKVCR